MSGKKKIELRIQSKSGVGGVKAKPKAKPRRQSTLQAKDFSEYDDDPHDISEMAFSPEKPNNVTGRRVRQVSTRAAKTYTRAGAGQAPIEIDDDEEDYVEEEEVVMHQDDHHATMVLLRKLKELRVKVSPC